ncbi:MAG: ATP-binding cassette domain-containing protein [Candidatus Peribacteria bacterium]|nr:MAG: ATP-binding cassette domain-containing protein [Candidatus Peribacteria bacterium]
MHQFGLEERSHAAITQLSGGEKQRVAIARALTNHPEFIIADEPTGNLDWTSTKLIGNTLIDINNLGNTVVVITHDQHLIQHVQHKHQVKIVQLHTP